MDIIPNRLLTSEIEYKTKTNKFESLVESLVCERAIFPVSNSIVNNKL